MLESEIPISNTEAFFDDCKFYNWTKLPADLLSL